MNVRHMVSETNDKIVVFGHYDHRFVIPKSEIVAAARNVIVGIISDSSPKDENT